MAPYVLCPLTFHRGHNLVRNARIHDALRLGITLDEITNATPPGFYVYKNSLVEVYFSQPAPVRPAPTLPQSSVGNARPSAISESLHGFSAFPNPNSSAPLFMQTVRTAVISWGRLNQGELESAAPYMYTLNFTFGVGNAQDPKWICIARTNRPLRYRLLLDVGGRTTTWVYSGADGVYSISEQGRARLTASQLKVYRELKARIPHTLRRGNVITTRYGSGDSILDLQPIHVQVTGICDMNDIATTVIRNFTIGAAVGFNFPTVKYPFDGILGLGRSFGDGFVSFGDWPSQLHPGPRTWVDIPVCATTPDHNGLWGLWLHQIDFMQPMQEPVIFRTEQWVMLDTGYAETYLRNDMHSKIIEHFINFWTHHGQNAPNALEQSRVRLVFRCGSPPSSHPPVYHYRSVTGCAKPFFFHPRYMPDEHGPLVPAITGIPPGQLAYLPGVLGINFFRTFVAGFYDRAAQPIVMLAPQP
ncbi:hypothetical protein AURDEDRAFT_176192 [Auricularia subglabra TFB-10046 SS5]|uniref:Peptidase A1 domain-containing protein n=1 Tax=Auricularia subglabra (strain TFB-10046 / SS5) TaxID=717982 RepID=J0WQF0_AURST|nr:hypothetical protein AURDEDRAFT_176192 [Auricularia subglabra TFB-10046 SS5]